MLPRRGLSALLDRAHEHVNRIESERPVVKRTKNSRITRVLVGRRSVIRVSRRQDPQARSNA